MSESLTEHTGHLPESEHGDPPQNGSPGQLSTDPLSDPSSGPTRQPVITAQPNQPVVDQSDVHVGTQPVHKGLEELENLEEILVKQEEDFHEEMFMGIEVGNRYKIFDSNRREIFNAVEESGFWTRQCLGPNRPFTIHIRKGRGVLDAIRVTRNFSCCGFTACACFPCCSHEVSVEAPPGHVVGFVKQRCSPWSPTFSVLDANRELILNIRGPGCLGRQLWCVCNSDQYYEVLKPDGTTRVGGVTKQWSGCMREMVTDADNFAVTFPRDADVRVKATLLGAVFLLDFMFYESCAEVNK